MDWTQIIVALITAAGTTAGVVLVNQREKRKDAALRQEREEQRKIEQQKIEEEKSKARTEQLEQFKKDILTTLEDHRTEYLNGIKEINDTITDMKAAYQTTVATVSLEIQNLEKKQDKHNSIIERTFKLEGAVDVLNNQNRTMGRILDVLEKKQ